ncbi:MAG: hypothetical protein GTO45_16365 [Candidatus Aminicenantes bacterium]|nr:hypothetical protein [Candidatus Aminicenantes bacterium]NIN19701.1 hypothetical protein [Candidatus Aminicenantes bacterium]NIN43583.1 hypothetical protein [Candidatus Aminicenantes bacterium]NIN86328.1 hypothetical protein [Candidatus Aminicenantes bacterium]NIO80260.1 hypothetical protein [Candidatus Aminicenantes bacterium]
MEAHRKRLIFSIRSGVIEIKHNKREPRFNKINLDITLAQKTFLNPENVEKDFR